MAMIALVCSAAVVQGEALDETRSVYRVVSGDTWSMRLEAMAEPRNFDNKPARDFMNVSGDSLFWCGACEFGGPAGVSSGIYCAERLNIVIEFYEGADELLDTFVIDEVEPGFYRVEVFRGPGLWSSDYRYRCIYNGEEACIMRWALMNGVQKND